MRRFTPLKGVRPRDKVKFLSENGTYTVEGRTKDLIACVKDGSEKTVILDLEKGTKRCGHRESEIDVEWTARPVYAVRRA